MTLLIKCKPKLIIGMGGYSSFPVCLSGFFLKIPIIIYETNLVLGRANKILLPFSKKTYSISSQDTSFDEINQAIQYYTNDPSSSALMIHGESKYFQGSLTQSRLESFERSIGERQGTPGDISNRTTSIFIRF